MGDSGPPPGGGGLINQKSLSTSSSHPDLSNTTSAWAGGAGLAGELKKKDPLLKSWQTKKSTETS